MCVCGQNIWMGAFGGTNSMGREMLTTAAILDTV